MHNDTPAYGKCIFATTEPHKVLATVISRCQRYDLRRIGLGELRAHLRRTADAEGLALSEEALALVAREAEGSLRDAQSLLEQVLTAAGGAADAATVRQVLGAADRRLVLAVADAILGGDPAACVRHLGELHAHGYDAQRFCRDLLEHFRHLTVLAATGERALVADLPEADVDALAAQAGRRSADDLQRFFRLLLEADEALAAPARHRERGRRTRAPGGGGSAAERARRPGASRAGPAAHRGDARRSDGASRGRDLWRRGARRAGPAPVARDG